MGELVEFLVDDRGHHLLDGLGIIAFGVCRRSRPTARSSSRSRAGTVRRLVPTAIDLASERAMRLFTVDGYPVRDLRFAGTLPLVEALSEHQTPSLREGIVKVGLRLDRLLVRLVLADDNPLLDRAVRSGRRVRTRRCNRRGPPLVCRRLRPTVPPPPSIVALLKLSVGNRFQLVCWLDGNSAIP